MSDYCYDRCNACRHTHYGASRGYRCPFCACNFLPAASGDAAASSYLASEGSPAMPANPTVKVGRGGTFERGSVRARVLRTRTPLAFRDEAAATTAASSTMRRS